MSTIREIAKKVPVAYDLARKMKRTTVQAIARYKFVHSLQPTDTFFVTYPKSGTNWLGFLITNALIKDELITFKSFMKYAPQISHIHPDRNIPIEPSDKYLNPRVFLTHTPWDPSLPNVIYVIRDPRDVMVSYWHWKRYTDKDFALSLPDFIRAGEQWPCTWSEHVSGWLFDHKHPNLIVVKYEEIHADTAGILRKVLKFSNHQCSREDIERAVKASQFEKMRQVEEKFGQPEEIHGDPKERFVRKGKVGSWREELDSESVRILESRLGDVMVKMGYQLSGGKLS